MNKIDFVVTWVDGNDPEWQEERARYMPGQNAAASATNRYRDWDLMRYWFRGVEKFAPWVNKVYFVTCGHYPEWLNLDHPKLVHVKHTDFIPAEYLPTYNSSIIHLHIHNIPGLSEQFVLFNDDVFLTNIVKEIDYFREGKPCGVALLGPLAATDPRDIFVHCMLNNTAIINKHFSKREVLRTHWRKFFSLRYGKNLIRNISLLPSRYFSYFHDLHLSAAYRKRTFYEVWELENAYLSGCSINKFRQMTDCTEWLMKDWQICTGDFEPRSLNWGKHFELGRDHEVYEAIRRQKYKEVCINDSDPDLDFEAIQKKLKNAFEAILPEMCSFEQK